MPNENKEQKSLYCRDTIIYKEKFDDDVIVVYESELEPDYAVLHEIENLKIMRDFLFTEFLINFIKFSRLNGMVPFNSLKEKEQWQ